MIMETKLIKIGNSRGVIIPRRFIERLQGDSFEIRAEGGQIILKPLQPKEGEVRAGWDESFAKAIQNAPPEADLFNEVSNDFDEEEWTW